MYKGSAAILTTAISIISLAIAPAANAQEESVPESITIPYVLSESPSIDGAVNRSGSYGPCTLKLDNVHLRKSGGWGTAGFKAHTHCTAKVTSIHHSSDLRYKYYSWWKLAVGGVTADARNTTQLDQTNLEFTCTGKVNTAFKGTTVGTIVYNGKTYYARGYSNTSLVPCKV